jgi:hypothetical protein
MLLLDRARNRSMLSVSLTAESTLLVYSIRALQEQSPAMTVCWRLRRREMVFSFLISVESRLALLADQHQNRFLLYHTSAQQLQQLGLRRRRGC